MNASVVLTIGALVATIFVASANAQEARKWTDIDCSRSKIVADAGLKCRTTQVYSGSDSRIAGAGAGGQFQRWISFGSGGDGSRVFYFASEAVGIGSSSRPTVPLQDVVRGFSSEYRSVGGFTNLVHVKGGDYQRFTGPKGEACVAIRKLGDSHGAGYRWLLDAGKCAAPGATLSDGDIETFLEKAQFRG